MLSRFEKLSRRPLVTRRKSNHFRKACQRLTGFSWPRFLSSSCKLSFFLPVFFLFVALNFFPFSFSLYPQISFFIPSLCILCFLPVFFVSVSSDFFLYSFSLYPHISFRFLSHCILRFPIFFFYLSFSSRFSSPIIPVSPPFFSFLPPPSAIRS